MNRRIVWIVCAGAVVTIALAWLLTSSRTLAPEVHEEELMVAQPTPTPAPPQRITLFFAGNDGQLHPEIREVPLPEEPDARVRVVVEELLAGPKSKLAAIVPYEAELRTVFVTADGQAFVDLTAPPEPLTGSATELILAYGVVNSILLNTELSAVQLLFGGNEVPSLTGHLDLSRPLVLNKRFIGS